MPASLTTSTPSLRPRILRRALLLWLLLLVALTGGYAVLYDDARRDLEAAARAGQHNALHEARTVLVNRLDAALRDIEFLSANPVLKGYLAGDSAFDRHLLGVFFHDLMATRHELFSQMRYLDETGMEVARVDNDADATAQIPVDALQDKSGRYYFTRSAVLQPGEVYVSPFDLNVENGQVETPFKPTLRFGTRAIDAEGRARGVLVVNFLGTDLIERLRGFGQAHRTQLWLANQNGDWLIGPDRDAEWRFMFPQRPPARIGDRYPQAWQSVTSGAGSRAIEVREQGDLLALSGIAPADVMPRTAGSVHTDPGMRWYLVAQVSADHLAAMHRGSVKPYLVSYLLLALLFAALSGWVAVLAERRREAVRAVEQRERKFHSVLELAPDAIVVSDASGEIVMVNAQAMSMFGLTRSSLVGQSIDALLPERHRAAHAHHRTDYVREPTRRMMGKGRELFALRADGSEFPASVGLSAVEWPEGLRVISVVRDVSEAHAQAAALSAANKRLRDALASVAASNHALAVSNRELESFSYSVSHDLRAPLRSVDGFSNILLKSYADNLDDQGRDMLRRMRAAAQRMGQLIDDMLVLSRISRAELQVEAIDLSAMAAAAVAQLREAFPEREVEVEIQPGLQVVADPRLVRIVLDNLLGNAWKFTGKTAHARIDFGSEDHKGVTEYFVRDNGAGFDMAYADKLFGAFQRLHVATEFPGTGIGLATVMRVIHKHGGEVRADGIVGAGATFRFTLSTVDPEAGTPS